jgi:hypothetical protein
MNTIGTEEWFVLYVAWCSGLFVSSRFGLGMFSLVVGAIGYYCFLKLASQLFQSDVYHVAGALEELFALCRLPSV